MSPVIYGGSEEQRPIGTVWISSSSCDLVLRRNYIKGSGTHWGNLGKGRKSEWGQMPSEMTSLFLSHACA